MKVYVDTSFLVSLYSFDTNSLQAAKTMRSSDGLHFITSLTVIEAFNALQLRVFRKDISPAQARTSIRLFEDDLKDGIFLVTVLSDQIFERARKISLDKTAQLGTRTADLLHVAAAVELEAEYLFSFDVQQRKLAQTLQLRLNRKA